MADKDRSLPADCVRKMVGLVLTKCFTNVGRDEAKFRLESTISLKPSSLGVFIDERQRDVPLTIRLDPKGGKKVTALEIECTISTFAPCIS